MREIKIKEGALANILNTATGVLLYIIIFTLVFYISIDQGLGVSISGLFGFIALILLTMYLSETVIISETNITHRKSFGLSRQEISFTEIKKIGLQIN